jgi:hypothetical protein
LLAGKGRLVGEGVDSRQLKVGREEGAEAGIGCMSDWCE